MKILGKRIMIVEDDLPLLHSLSFTLKRQKCLVDTASNGKDALGRILEARQAGAPFHLLVTDIGVPGISGLELIDRLHELGARIPILVITAGADKDLAAQLIRRGGNDLLVKPFDADEFVKRIASILERGQYIQ
jgi:DNA-binding response OmpR family regulator